MAGVRALKIVQHYFPNVTKVKDAKKNLSIDVTKQDAKEAARRNHESCAMAVACKRKEHADGVIMSVSTAYIIKGNTATRYKVPESVSREIVAFDRDAYFEPGEYRLIKPCPTNLLGARTGAVDLTSKPRTKNRKGFQHMTGGIRTALSEN